MKKNLIILMIMSVLLVAIFVVPSIITAEGEGQYIQCDCDGDGIVETGCFTDGTCTERGDEYGYCCPPAEADPDATTSQPKDDVVGISSPISLKEGQEASFDKYKVTLREIDQNSITEVVVTDKFGRTEVVSVSKDGSAITSSGVEVRVSSVSTGGLFSRARATVSITLPSVPTAVKQGPFPILPPPSSSCNQIHQGNIWTTLNGDQITINYIDQNQVILDLNGQLIGPLYEEDTFQLSNGDFMTLTDNFYTEKETGSSSVVLCLQPLHRHLVDREIRIMQFEIDSPSYGKALNLGGSTWWANLPGYNTNLPGNKAQIAIFNIGGKKMLRTQALVSCGSGEVATGGGYNIGAANPTVVGAIPQQGDYNVVMNAPLNSIISGAEGWGIEIFEPYTDINNDGLDDEGAMSGWVYTICAKQESSLDLTTAHFS